MADRCIACIACNSCQDGDGERCTCNCDAIWSCPCSCNQGSVIDKFLNASVAVGGFAAFCKGMAMASGGAAVPLLLGEIIAGAGIFSFRNGFKKFWKGKKFSCSEYLKETVIGGATGFTAGVGGNLTEAAAGMVVTNVAKEGFKRGASKLVVRVVGGAATELASNSAGEYIFGGKRKRDADDGPETQDLVHEALFAAGGGTLSHFTINTCNLLPTAEARKVCKLCAKLAGEISKGLEGSANEDSNRPSKRQKKD